MKTKSIAYCLFLILFTLMATAPAFAWRSRYNRPAAYVDFEAGGGLVTMPYGVKSFSNIIAGADADFTVKYSMLFNGQEGWGFSVGGGLHTFQGSRLVNDDLRFQTVDDEGYPYLLMADVRNWTETQHIYSLVVPLSLFYQTRSPGASAGLYLSFGFRLYVPLYGNYNVPTGNLTTRGYYEQWGGTLLEDLPQHGFGYYDNFHPSGRLELPRVMGSVNFQIGTLIDMSKNVEVLLTGYVEHGMNNMIRPSGTTPLFVSPTDYRGYYSSSMTSNNIPLMFGIRIGIRLKDIYKCNCISY